MKKSILFLSALLISVMAFSKSVSLNPGVWDVDGAKFAVWHWQGASEGAWSAFMTKSGSTYTTTIADNSNKVIFVRINSSASTPNWEAKWNQTADLDYKDDCTFTIEGWGEGDNPSYGSWDSNCTTTVTGYYLTGDGTWTGGAEWDPAAAELTDGKIVISGLAAGSYTCKITNGSWSESWGASAVDPSCTNVTTATGENDNIEFTLSAKADLTITFNGSVICLSTNGDTKPIINPQKKTFATPTPSNCGDVMLQAFYYDSYKDKGYGDTKWATLLPNISEMAAYFDMIWLPPSSASAGGTGYHPTQFCKQTSDWGTEENLKEIISIIHENGSKVIADIVLNHRWNKSSWCDFYAEDFGDFGQWQLTAEHICGDDEMYSAPDAKSCLPTKHGNNDTGETYAAARDLDHTSSYVQNFSKAYLKWLMNVMDYDGFRYDVAKGYGAQYFGMYNADSKPYFSVGEYFDGDYDRLKAWVDGTGKQSTTFDFAFKYNAIGNAFHDGGSPDLSQLVYGGQPRGFVGAEYRQYSVTFIDNHDTFEREDNQGSEFLGYKKSMTEANRTNVLMANAYLLSMPGIPCVFYPHYVKNKAAIQDMVKARKTAGVTNTSSVEVQEVGSDKLIAVVNGTKGKLMLKLGSGAGVNNTPSGYKAVAKGTNYAMYVESGLTVVNPTPKATLKVNPAGGKFAEAQKVTITCSESGAKIYYTTDGTEPTTSSTLYSAPITISQNTTLKTFAVASTGNTSVQTHEYTFVDTSKPITVTVYKPRSWSKIYLYSWLNDGKELCGAWPGTELTEHDGEWYKYTYKENIRPLNIIFNVGSNVQQTQDFMGVMESACYYINNITGMATEDPTCSYIDTAVENIENTNAAIPQLNLTQPMYNVLGQQVAPSYHGIVIQNGQKYLR